MYGDFVENQCTVTSKRYFFTTFTLQKQSEFKLNQITIIFTQNDKTNEFGTALLSKKSCREISSQKWEKCYFENVK